MIAEIAKVLGNIPQTSDKTRQPSDQPHIAVIEAGTGTGKTVAYLLATLPIAQALNKKLIISTATVALQEQIIQKDLPEIKKHSDLHFNYTLAKGRGRYLCLSKVDRVLVDAESQQQVNQALYEDEIIATDANTLGLYQTMVEKLAEGSWDGDRDQWPNEIDDVQWRPITTNHRECTGRRCSNVTQCSFFRARESLDKFDVIVANHDLVLSDLALGGGAILTEPNDTIYVFDEGHHLADKALNHFAHHSRVNGTLKWLDQTNKSLKSVAGTLSDGGHIDHILEQLPAVILDAKQSFSPLLSVCETLMASVEDDRFASAGQSNQKRYRFENGLPDSVFLDFIENSWMSFGRLTKLYTGLSETIQSLLEDAFSPVPRVDLESWFPVIGSWLARSEAIMALLEGYRNAGSDSEQQSPVARWVTEVEFSGSVDYEICSSPILASNTLNHSLWQECYGAVVTSATLTALGRFDQFRMRSGTNENQHYNVMPSPFDFSRGELSIPPYSVEANQAQAHTDSLIEHLPQLFDKDHGSLVLFSSRRQMETVYEEVQLLSDHTIYMQGEYAKSEMLTRHKTLIDAGEPSVLFGLASFAEGIDLPGNYCRHVIIAKLPFSVPDDPIEAALSEWITSRGGNPFMEITVPDACVRLLQACGRLLRKEEDSGKITILDKRLLTKFYGKLILQSLPAFKRI